MDTTRTTDLPEWAIETPYPEEYALVMEPSQGGSFLQRVDLTRAEYITLKARLAQLRGLEIPKAEERGAYRVNAVPMWEELGPNAKGDKL